MVDVRVIGLTLARGKLTLTVVLMKSDVLDLEVALCLARNLSSTEETTAFDRSVCISNGQRF